MTFEKELENAINAELDKSENIWNQVKDDILEKSIRNFSGMNESLIPTKIPGYPFLNDGQGKVGDFIAFVLDIRDSTDHLLQRISERITPVTQLQRVFYETTAINACGVKIIKKYNGGITEFLGDGFLALFEAKNNTDVYPSFNAAKKCMSSVKEIVNPILQKRYNLPSLEIGIGLAYSKAIVTIIGADNEIYPKAFGECVFRASKLSNGRNEILFDECLKQFWPKESGGSLQFLTHNHKNSTDVKGYIAISK